MEKNYCENCGSIHNLASYEHLKALDYGIVLCDDCSYLLVKQIKRQEYGDEKIVLRDLESA